MTRTTPYYCPLCLDEQGCGYHGILRFDGEPVPTCNHHVNDTNQPQSVKMRPVAERDDASH